MDLKIWEINYSVLKFLSCPKILFSVTPHFHTSCVNFGISLSGESIFIAKWYIVTNSIRKGWSAFSIFCICWISNLICFFDKFKNADQNFENSLICLVCLIRLICFLVLPTWNGQWFYIRKSGPKNRSHLPSDESNVYIIGS